MDVSNALIAYHESRRAAIEKERTLLGELRAATTESGVVFADAFNQAVKLRAALGLAATYASEGKIQDAPTEPSRAALWTSLRSIVLNESERRSEAAHMGRRGAFQSRVVADLRV